MIKVTAASLFRFLPSMLLKMGANQHGSYYKKWLNLVRELRSVHI